MYVLSNEDSEEESNDLSDLIKESDGVKGSGSDMSDYDSDKDPMIENDSDSDLEKDLLAKCLNREEFNFQPGQKVEVAKGMIFETRKAFRKVIYEQSIQSGFKLRKIKNESKRVTVGCAASDCEWRVHASLLPDGITFAIKTCNPVHTCQTIDKIQASARWMADKISSLVRGDRNIKKEVLREELMKFGLQPTRFQLQRARKIALEKVDGSHAESFQNLPHYCRMVMKTNPGSIATIEFGLTLGDPIPSVKRFFVGFEGLKKGFMEGCKPYLGFDGCHLKGIYGGVLLSAVGMDGNSGLFPLAFAYVESENKDSWTFFFNLLEELLGGFNPNLEWTFMTDRQKVIYLLCLYFQ